MMTVFRLSWGTSALGYTRKQFLIMQLFGVLFFALRRFRVSAVLAEARPPRDDDVGNAASAAYGIAMPTLFTAGTPGVVPAGDRLRFDGPGLRADRHRARPSSFPTAVRYTGSSITYNVAGIFGASLAPYAAQTLAREYGLPAVGAYLAAFAMFSFCGLLMSRETRDAVL